nr:PIN domain-containing protein [Nocardia transvalensis]
MIDTSGLVRLLSDQKLQDAWGEAVGAHAVASCDPQRAEFLYSAPDAREFDEISEMYGDLYPDVAVPKHADRWIGVAQYRMSRAGEHRCASAVDLLIAATAAHHGLTVLHDSYDYRTLARHTADLREHNIRDVHRDIEGV